MANALHIADIIVVIFYLICMAGIGFWTAKKIKSSDDFFLPRKFGKFMMMMFSFGAGTHSDQAVSVASKSFTNGLSGIWYQWLWLPVTPFYWLIAPVFRRLRAITTSDIFELRYNRSVAVLYALVGIWSLIVGMGVMLKGSGEVISASTSGLLSANMAIILMTIIFVIYGVAGGLAAAIWTDFIQGILTIIFSFLLLPFILNAVGGMSGLREKLADPEMLSLVAPGEIGFFYVAIIALNGLIGIVTQPHTLSNCAAGKTEMEGRVGFMFGSIIKRLCTVPWCLTGVAAVVYFAGREVEPDKVFGMVASDFLPKIRPGVLGMFLAAILASVMSSCDAMMISCSALFTENVYKYFVPGRANRHYMVVARFASIFIVLSCLIFAYTLTGVVKGLEIFWMICPMMGITFWLGLFWRRTTVAGAWASCLTAAGVWFISTRGFFVDFVGQFDGIGGIPFVVEKAGGRAVFLPWQMVFYLTGGFSAGIIVSLVTRGVVKEKLDNFYALLRTPIRKGEVVPAACTLPVDAVVPPKRNFFPNTNLEIPVPSVTAVVGFIVGWVCAAIIVGSVILLIKI